MGTQKIFFHENIIMFCQHWWQFTGRTDYPGFKGHKGDSDVLAGRCSIEGVLGPLSKLHKTANWFSQ